jgi:parallel beta-helix repeat protein
MVFEFICIVNNLSGMVHTIKTRSFFLLIGLVILTMLLPGVVSAQFIKTDFRIGTGNTPIIGDWNGNGKTEVGAFQNGVWYLDCDENSVWNPGTDKIYNFGTTGWTPVTGDWNGDDHTKIGVYRDGVWYLDYNGNGVWNAGTDKVCNFGTTGWTPVRGDWDGNGKTEIGVYRDGVWYLDYNGNGVWNAGTDKVYNFGTTGWTPVRGDWDGNGKTEIGVFQNGVWYLDYNGHGVWNAGTDKVYNFGATGSTPFTGDWNGDDHTKIGVFHKGVWYLDYTGNGVWNTGTDKQYSFGPTGYQPVVGDWNGDGKTKTGLTNGNSWYLDKNGDGVSTPLPTPSTPSITVTAPNGGETWKRGTSNTITWSYTGSPGSTVKIELLKGSTTVGTIAGSVPIGSGGKGTYTWPISSTGTTGSDYKVSVQSTSQPAVKDTSNNYFTLISGTTISGTTNPSTTPTPVSTINNNLVSGSSSLNLADFGIKGDGTDETAKLQSAFDYARAHSIRTVVFPQNKVITITSMVRIWGGLTVVGNGATLKRKAYTAIYPGSMVSVWDGARVSGLIIDGNYWTDDYGNSETYSDNGVILGDNVVFDNNEVKNVRAYSVQVYGDSNVVITNNKIHDSYQYGITTGGGVGGESHNIIVTGNTIYNCQQVGIKIRGTHGAVIRNNKITMPENSQFARGISLYSFDLPNDDILIDSNTITGSFKGGNMDGISSDDSRNTKIRITNNIVSKCDVGIDLHFTGGTITGNKISESSSYITGTGGNTVTNNILL